MTIYEIWLIFFEGLFGQLGTQWTPVDFVIRIGAIVLTLVFAFGTLLFLFRAFTGKMFRRW